MKISLDDLHIDDWLSLMNLYWKLESSGEKKHITCENVQLCISHMSLASPNNR